MPGASPRFLLLSGTLALLLTVTAGTTLFLKMLRNNCDVITVNHVELPAAPDYPELRVALLSDLHVRPEQRALERLEEIVRRTNAEHPDLILLAGDFVAGHLERHAASPDEIARRLGALRAPLGVYAVLGNHDHWQRPERIAAALENAGITMLENRAALLVDNRTGTLFSLAGATDGHRNQNPDWNDLLPYPGLPVLLLTHTPDILATLPPGRIIAFAGHTHGGQIVLPLFGPPILPSKYGRRYASGTVQENGNTIFITTGLGTSLLPLRLNCPPEIALLELRR